MGETFSKERIFETKGFSLVRKWSVAHDELSDQSLPSHTSIPSSLLMAGMYMLMETKSFHLRQHSPVIGKMLKWRKAMPETPYPCTARLIADSCTSSRTAPNKSPKRRIARMPLVTYGGQPSNMANRLTYPLLHLHQRSSKCGSWLHLGSGCHYDWVMGISEFEPLISSQYSFDTIFIDLLLTNSRHYYALNTLSGTCIHFA